MLLDVQIKVVVMAVNKHNPQNTYILLEKDEKNLLRLPQPTLTPGETFVSLIQKKINNVFNFSGQWLETLPRQSGAFQHLAENKLYVVYSLLMPAQEKIFLSNYRWEKLDNIMNNSLEKLTAELIKFVVEQGDRYVF